MSDIDKLQRTTGGGGENRAVNQRILIKIDNREITSVLKYEATRLAYIRYCIERKIAIYDSTKKSLSLSFSICTLGMRAPESSATASKVSVSARGVWNVCERRMYAFRNVTSFISAVPA